MSDQSNPVSVNLPVLRDIYRAILIKTTPYNSLDRACKLALSGKPSLTAFWQVLADVPEATIVRDNPARIDLNLYKSGTLSIFNLQGAFGRRILDHSTGSIKKLNLECAPIWARGWLKEFVNHDRLQELFIGRAVEKGAFGTLAQIAKSVKKLTDKTGEVVPKLKEGNFDFVCVQRSKFSWPQNVLSNIKFTTDYLQCVVDDEGTDYRLDIVQREFSKVSSKKLASVKTFHIYFMTRVLRDFQPFIDTIVEIMPNVKTIILDLKMGDPGLNRSHKFLPNNLGRIYEAFQNLVAPLGVTVKVKVASFTDKMFVYNNNFQLPNRIINVLGIMQKVPLGRNVKVSTSTRSLEYERNRYQRWVFDAGNEMGPQKEFSIDLIIYVEKF